MRLAAVEAERQQALDRLRSLGEEVVPASSTAAAGAAATSSPAVLGLKTALGQALAEEQRAAERALQAEQCLQGLAAHERAAQASRPHLKLNTPRDGEDRHDAWVCEGNHGMQS